MSGAGRTASLVAVLLTGLLLAFLFATETPTGRVEGRVVIRETKQPLADAEIYLTPYQEPDKNPDMTTDAAIVVPKGDARQRRRTRTDAEGRFRLLHIPTGKYAVSAVSRAHRSEAVPVLVSEAKTATQELQLKRSEPDLAVATHQQVFTTSESLMLPVRGYADVRAGGEKDALRVRIYRTRLSNVLRSGDAADALDRIGHTWEAPLPALPASLLRPEGGIPAPTLISDQSLPITEADREGFFHKRIPLGARGAGLFLIQVGHGKKSVTSWLLGTNTALVVKRAREQMVVYTVDLKTGAPVGGASVLHYWQGRVAASATTDASGLATLRVPFGSDPDANKRRPLTVATRGSDEAVLGRSSYFYEESGAYLVHTYTDRTIYRPGDTVSYKAIVRRKNGNAYAVPRGVQVEVEIRDPSGERLTRTAKATDSHGSFDGALTLSTEAPSGSYSVVTQIAGETYTSDITVASYRKPEFAVTVTPAKKRYVRGDTVEMTVEGKFYFGAPVAGAKVRYSVYRDTDWAAEYGGGEASDDEEDATLGRESYGGYYGTTVMDGEVTLGDDGKAVVRFPADVTAKGPGDDENGDRGGKPVSPEDVPQEQIYTLTASVTDNAQREVSSDGAARVSAGDYVVSVTPEGYLGTPNTATSIVVRTRDHDGKPVANASVSLTPSYSIWDQKAKEVKTTPLTPITGTTGSDGTAVLAVTPPRAGDLRLAAKATDTNGRDIYARSYLWVSSDSGGDLGTEYSDLSLLTNKRRYLPGETARVLVNTARVGQTVLLTVEGERVYQTLTVPITRRSTVVSVPVAEAYGPNVTLKACYVQKKKFASSEIPLRVTLARRTLSVRVTPDRPKYEPGQLATYAVRITDAKGRPAAGCPFSLGVVDESIYALRADDPKAMQRAFYPARYNRVSTDYSFSVQYLGDADKSEPKISARRKFRDTAYWRPSAETDGDGRASITVTLPDNLTTWRASVYACSDDTALGYAQSKVIATKPFFVRLETPRFLTQGDETRFLTLVHNETGRDQSVSVRLVATGLERKSGGSDTQTVRVKSGQDETITWPLQARTVGDASLRVTAWTEKNDGGPFTDGIEKTLPIRAWGHDSFTAVAGVLQGGDSSVTKTLLLDQAAVPEATRLQVRITPSVSGALVGSLDYLIGYPYGCTEQTLSRFVPDLLVERLRKRLGRTLLRGTAKGADLPAMVRDGLTRLRATQHGDGGWGWWQNDGDDAFMTAYALYGLSVAKAEGYAVGDETLRKGREAGAKLLAKAPIADQPFLLYALALAGDTDTARRLVPALPLRKIAPDGLAYLVLLEKELGGNAAGSTAFAELERRALSDGSLLHWKNPERRWNGSDRMATALALRAFIAVRPDDERIPRILRWLMQSRTDGFFGDTRDTAWVLTALCDYLDARPSEAAIPSGILTVRVNDQPVESMDAAALEQSATQSGAPGRDAERIIRVPASYLRPGPNTLTVESTSGATVFYTASLRQTIAVPDGQRLAALSSPALEPGLTITREYLRVLPRKASDRSFDLATEDTGNRFDPGDAVRVRLTITAPREVGYVLIEDAFPSGFEPTERGTAEQDFSSEGGDWGWWYSNVDVRDDRIAVFARALPRGKHVFEYNLRAQTPGTCRALPAQLQGMYAEGLRVESADTSLEVR
ncbi:MAG: hypothetical protein H7Z41_17850 [Cytophagales bacterium]|nr:hypothetical protein [Armatimonadota bacterium]